MRYFLLDTGILLGLARKAAWARQAWEQLPLNDQETAAVTSVIYQGEILALAEKFGWGEERRGRLEQILKRLPVLDINRQLILSAYARIDSWTHGRPVHFPGLISPPPRPAIPMKQNDLWIAATAHATKATLVSTDRDFSHLDKVWLRFIHVDQSMPDNA